MLDALCAPARSAWPDGARRVSVNRDVCAPSSRRLHRCPDLGLGVLRGLDGVVRRGDAPATHELDLLAPRRSCSSGAQSDLIGTVSDGRETIDLGSAQWAACDARELRRCPEVAMTRCLRDDRSRRTDPRPDDDPSSIARFSPKTGPPKSRTVVKPRMRVASAARAATNCVYAGSAVSRIISERYHHRVPVRVDEPGYQHSPVRRDDANVRLAIDRDRVR